MIGRLLRQDIPQLPLHCLRESGSFHRSIEDALQLLDDVEISITAELLDLEATSRGCDAFLPNEASSKEKPKEGKKTSLVLDY